MRSKNLKWWRNAEGSQDYTILVQTYHGPLVWEEWQKDNKIAKEMIDEVEGELLKLDEKNGAYTKVHIFIDLTDTDLYGIETISKLYELATSTGFTLPRAGKIFIIGTNAKNEPYSKSLIKKSLEVFTRIFSLQSRKLFLADSLEQAYDLIHQKVEN